MTKYFSDKSLRNISIETLTQAKLRFANTNKKTTKTALQRETRTRIADCCASIIECYKHILKKILQFLMFFYSVLFFFVRGVMKRSDKTPKLRHIRQSNKKKTNRAAVFVEK